jgi:tetratricopeptide (TPR) repeat protein
VFAAALALAMLPQPAGGQAQRAAPVVQAFRVAHYEVETILETDLRGISARARVDLEALEPARIIDFELHSLLTVDRVRDAAGAELLFERDAGSDRLRVTLPAPATPGQPTVLHVEYGGPLTTVDPGGSRAVRLAQVNAEGGLLLRAARWFPLLQFPGSRYTARFRIHVPETMSVTGTGLALAPEVAPSPAARPGEAAPISNRPPVGRSIYTFTAEEPEAVGTFIAGDLRLIPVQAGGMTVQVFSPPGTPGAEAWGQAMAEIVTSFSADFGPLPERTLRLVQIPDGSIDAGAAPGVAMIARRRWRAEPDRRLLARAVAGLWWGGRVLPATANDVWLADGLARYSEALYVEEAEGEGALNSALEDFAVGALMYEDASPVAQAGRLAPYSSEYRSVVMNKGAMVFHMLRSQMGRENFLALVREFYERFAGRTARLDDFRAMAAAAMERAAGQPVNLTPFFTQWLNSTGVPDFRLEYVVYRTPRGFRVVGKVEQDLETFRMEVGLRVDTEGNPEFKTIEIRGTESNFSVETFGRPKPNGLVLDPNNHLLRGSPQLRVRAAIARGEEMAEAGQFFEAIQHYQQAISMQPNSSLAHFRMGEAMFFQRNPQAAANAFRNALDGDLQPAWIQVWSHIYIGKIFDIAGLRERAVNEYQRALELNDDTGGARAEAERYLREPYQEDRPGS